MASPTHHHTALGSSAARPSSAAHGTADEPDHGVRIITLAGSNSGASMKANGIGGEVTETYGVMFGDRKSLRAYTNSNYQGINNSVMLGGSCTSEDPGVHVDISDLTEDGKEEEVHEKDEKKKGKERASLSGN